MLATQSAATKVVLVFLNMKRWEGRREIPCAGRVADTEQGGAKDALERIGTGAHFEATPVLGFLCASSANPLSSGRRRLVAPPSPSLR